jgi:hypothetical protein
MTVKRAVRKTSATELDYSVLRANRLLPKPKRKAGNKARSAAINTSITARFLGTYADGICEVGMR